jgi:hypothetical protein
MHKAGKQITASSSKAFGENAEKQVAPNDIHQYPSVPLARYSLSHPW